jgi:hypothetical protein
MCGIEMLKMRRTLTLAMVVIAPFSVVALQMMLWANRPVKLAPATDPWVSFAEGTLTMWAIFMGPLFAALVVALVYHVDDASQGWMRLFTLPVPRWTVPAAKLTTTLLLALAAMLVLGVVSLGGAAVMGALKPEVDMPAHIPLAAIAARMARVLATSLLVLAIQNAVSLRFASLTASLGVGIGGTFSAVFGFGWKYGSWHPWLMSVLALHGRPDQMTRILTVSAVATLLLVAATLIYGSRRDPAHYG